MSVGLIVIAAALLLAALAMWVIRVDPTTPMPSIPHPQPPIIPPSEFRMVNGFKVYFYSRPCPQCQSMRTHFDGNICLKCSSEAEEPLVVA